MKGVSVHGNRVVMPACFLRSLILHDRRQRATIAALHERLNSRENVLARALQELAVRDGQSNTWLYARRFERVSRNGGEPKS